MKRFDYNALIFPIVIGVVLYLINSNFLKFLFEFYPPSLELTFGRGGWWLTQPAYIKIIYVGFIAPFIEELVFRKFMLGRFIREKQFVFWLIVSSIVFGLWHIVIGWGILKAVDMFVVGIIFGLVYRKYGFKGSLLSHFANNWVALWFMIL
ncbi:MAG: CPBP family intramembrane metalloprotease [Candidatus Aenigmarchaeota archaeon]|nr:CPBP family intramembrane metalloprotease [Candidatus Aenigmarchaeota archaeon]